MSDRPYFYSSTSDLITIFDDNQTDPVLLEQLAHELSCRRKKKAQELLLKINRALEELPPAMEQDSSSSPVQIQTNADSIEPSSKNVPDLTHGQRIIVECDEDTLMLVEAGPGTGKTAVACSRVAYLIESHGLAAPKVLLVSFTRTAVKELQDRIESFASNPRSMVGVRIMTLDSMTWQVVRGLGDHREDELFQSYENNIREFTKMLRDGDANLLDYISEFEHVVIDESQDLVGPRADLCLELIGNLDPECGVTIFADSAQAIYGFTSDLEGGENDRGQTLVHRIRTGESKDFNEEDLDEIHRTSSRNLINLFSAGRRRLRGKMEGNKEDWLKMRALIEENADGKVGSVTHQELNYKRDHLVLYRTRTEVLIASSFLWEKGVAHKMRMSRTQARIIPWLARLFYYYEDDQVSCGDLQEIWESRDIPGSFPDALSLLQRFASSARDQLSLSRLRAIAGRDRPPVEFLMDESELEGPVLGTIHASKGREANTVHLMLPVEEYIESTGTRERTGTELAEEERVLYVGATRAQQELFVGTGNKRKSSRLESGRSYKRIKPKYGKKRCQVEVGLDRDFNVSSLVSDNRPISEVLENQEWLWAHRNECINLQLRYDLESRKTLLKTEEDERLLGWMSSFFKQELFDIARNLGVNHPYSNINNLRMIGVSTAVLPEVTQSQAHAPWCHSRLILTPVISGFPVISFS